MSRKLGLLMVLVLMLGVILPASTVTYAQTPDEWFAAAAEPYQGVTIRGISESTPPSQFIADVIVPAFEEATGINVEFELTSWDEMYDKGTRDMEAGTGIYDFWYTEQDFVYGAVVNEWLVDLTAMMEANPELIYPDLDLGDFTAFADNFRFDGELYGIPMEGFIKSVLYRKDLFEDPDIMAAFKEQYGWDLRPAVNYDEYAQIAEFFTNYGQENGLELWGTTITAATHPAAAAELTETLWPSWGIYNWGINLDNFRATSANGGTLDSPQAKACMAWYLKMLDYAPPEARSSTWDEVAASMGAGRAAQGFIYLENLPWIELDETRSSVTGNIGVALLPLVPGVINDAIKGEGYIGYYDGGAFAIPHSSNNKEAAWLWLQYQGRKEFQPDWAVTSGRIVRNSTLEAPEVQALDADLDGYFTMLTIAGPLFRGNPPLANLRQLIDIYVEYVAKAVAGELTADEACDQLAQRVDEVMIQLGYAEE